jgi:hypothetical protein
MTESAIKSSIAHSNDEASEVERPSKKPRIDREELDEDEEEDPEPMRQTEEIKASDLYLDTASAMTLLGFRVQNNNAKGE